jgi:hypothetical protein
MLRRLSKRRQTRLEADIRLLDKRLAEMVAANGARAKRSPDPYAGAPTAPGHGAAARQLAGPPASIAIIGFFAVIGRPTPGLTPGLAVRFFARMRPGAHACGT